MNKIINIRSTGSYDELYGNKLDNLEEMENFLGT